MKGLLLTVRSYYTKKYHYYKKIIVNRSHRMAITRHPSYIHDVKKNNYDDSIMIK